MKFRHLFMVTAVSLCFSSAAPAQHGPTYITCRIVVTNAGDKEQKRHRGVPRHVYQASFQLSDDAYKHGDYKGKYLAFVRNRFEDKWLSNPYGNSAWASVSCNAYGDRESRDVRVYSEGYDEQENWFVTDISNMYQP